MNAKKIFQYIFPFTLFIVAALFVYNIASHGTVVHPGEASYKSNCSECHGDNGEGIKSLVPPLIKSDFAQKNMDSLPCWLKFGLNHPIVVNGTAYDQPMYPFDTMRLDEIQIANIINFMNKEYYNSDKTVNPQWVRDRWKGCK